MYYFLSLFTGVIIALMIVQNGEVSALHGVYASTFIVHFVGLIIQTPIVIKRRDNPFRAKLPLFFFCGGVFGFIVTACNNISFGRISVSAILALGLLGQSIMSLFVDQYGMFGMPQHKFKKQRILGLIIVLIGTFIMIEDFEIVAVTASIVSGATLVIQRCANGKLAEKTSVMASTYCSYLIGAIISLIALFVLGSDEAIFSGFTFSSNYIIYLGGALGTMIVICSNICVQKVPAFYLAILMFVGQVFTGLIVDAMIYGTFTSLNLIGGSLVSLGLILDMVLDRKSK